MRNVAFSRKRRMSHIYPIARSEALGVRGVRKAALISVFGIDITLGGLILIAIYIVQTLILTLSALYLKEKLSSLNQLSAAVGSLLG